MMRRRAARRQYGTDDVVVQTPGVECRKDDRVSNEIPAAYKAIDTVTESQNDLVDIVHTLKQAVCVKG